jgi:glucosamine 6-phosphate synthetase-like amidotransferase/phosphosugar isomerase protein
MCGIFGIICLNGCSVGKEKLKSITSDLFIKSESRGTHASGVCISSKNHINVLKDMITASEFVDRDEYKSFMDESLIMTTGNPEKNNTFSIIGHCRFQTKGSKYINVNNHPIVTEDTVGVHNGMISNDDTLFESYKIAGNNGINIKRNGEVDSEIIFKLYEYFVKIGGGNPKFIYKSSLNTISNMLKGSYSCALVHRNIPHIVWLFRNNNPLVVKYYNKYNIIVFASVEQFITYSMLDIGEKEAINISVGSNEAIAINTIDNKFMRFNIAKAFENNTRRYSNR